MMKRSVNKTVLLLFLTITCYSQDYRVKASVALDPTNSYTIGEASNYYVAMGGLTFSQTGNWIQHNPECILPFIADPRNNKDYVVVADNQRSNTCYFDWYGPTPSTVNTYVEGNLPVVIRQTTHKTFSVTHSVSYGQPITPCITYTSWDKNTDNRVVSPLTRIEYTFIPYNEKILNTISGSTLTIDQKFKLEFQSGNVASGWRYSLDYGKSWIDYGNRELSLRDLGISRDDLPNKQIMFQGIACGNLGVYSDIILIDVIPNSPLLISTEHTPTSCFSSDDGRISLTFDRNLETGYKMRYFLYDATANIDFDPARDNPPQAIDQEIWDKLLPKNDGSGHFSGTLRGLSHGSYKMVYQEFYDQGNGTDNIVKSGGITMPFTIERPTQITLDTSVQNFFTNATCGMPAIFNLNNTASGGRLLPNGYYSYEYSLDNGLNWLPVNMPDNILEISSTTDSQSVQLRGVYTVDDTRCIGKTYPFLISSVVKSVDFTDFSVGTTSTAEASDGSLRVAFSGGVPPYKYSLSQHNPNTNTFNPLTVDPFPISIPGGQAVSFNGLPSGIFRVTVADANNCLQISPDLILGTDTIPTLGTPEVTQMDCKDSRGVVRVAVSDFNTSYRYQWIHDGLTSPIQNSNSPDIILDNITVSGTYILRVAAGRVSNIDFENDVNVNATSIQIEEPISVNITNVAPTATRCNDTNDGSIDLVVSGGKSYEYTLELFPTEKDWHPLEGTTITDLVPGTYRVTVRNQDGCESNTLQNILVKRAPILETAFIKTDVTTYNGYEGSITLAITGGTPFTSSANPYSITWQKDNLPYMDSNPSTPYSLEGLSVGQYQATVTDLYNCSSMIMVKIAQPDIIEETIVPPTCWDSSDGRISILVNKGIGDFTYTWNTGENSSTLTNLTAGQYTVTIFGLENEPITKTYTIEAPSPLLLDLKKDGILCTGQGMILYSSAENDSVTYSWTSDVGFTSNDSNILIDIGGNYTLTITSENGCSATETIFVPNSNNEINAEFAVASQAFIGEPIIAVDISFPLPENLEWVLPTEATVLNQDSDEVELLFEEPGEYEIGIITKIGNCLAEQTKKVLVMTNDTSLITPNSDPRKIIEHFTLHPNPTSGKFVADVILPEVGNISIKVFNFTNNALMTQNEGKNESSYSVLLDISGLPSGIYAVVLETAFGNALRKIILN